MKRNSKLPNIIIRKFMNAVGYVGALFVVYAGAAGWRSFSVAEIERFMVPLSYYLTLVGVILTCATVYFYEGNPHPPEQFSRKVSAPVVIMASLVGIWFVYKNGSIPTLAINGFAMLGLAGAWFRIQPATAE